MPVLNIVNLSHSEVVISDTKKDFPTMSVPALTTKNGIPILGKELESAGPVLKRLVDAGTITYTTGQDPAIPDDTENLMGPAAISDGAVTAKKLAVEHNTARQVRAVITTNVADFTSVSTTLDGLTLIAGNRVLAKGQTDVEENGIYVVGTVGGGNAPWTRSTDMAAGATLPPCTLIEVSEGTAGANTIHMVTNAAPITVDTTDLTFTTVKTAAELASVAASKGISLLGVQDANANLKGNTTGETVIAGLATGNGARPLAPTRACRAVATANIASFASVSTTLDGLTLVQGDRILVKGQTVASQNGIYVVGVVGGGNAPWTRDNDMAAAAVIPTGTMISVVEGTAGANTIHRITNAGPVTIASTGLTFECFSIAKNGLTAKLVVAAKAANAWQVVGSIVDDAGVVQASVRDVLIETMAVTADKGDLAAASTPIGTTNVSFNPATGANAQYMTTTSGGLFSFSIADSATETVFCRVSGPGLRPLFVTVGPA